MESMAEQGMETQQELEHQRQWELLLILQKIDLARKDGYLTQQDVEDVQRAFGLSTMKRSEHGH